MKDCIKDYIKKYPLRTGLIITIVIFLLFSLATYFIQSNPENNFETYFIYYVGALIVSVLLLFIAYIQSRAALAQSKTNYLLSIDKRWSSTEVIKAREIIHEFYLSAKEKNYQLTQYDLNYIIGQQILLISKINKPNQINKFISLLNFLDFLETIGYMYHTDSLLLEDIQELLGNSIMYFYKIFEAYILYRRKKDPRFYEMFEALYLDLCKCCENK